MAQEGLMAGGMGCLAGRDAEASKVGTAVPIQLQCADSSTVAPALTPRLGHGQPPWSVRLNEALSWVTALALCAHVLYRMSVVSYVPGIHISPPSSESGLLP